MKNLFKEETTFRKHLIRRMASSLYLYLPPGYSRTARYRYVSRGSTERVYWADLDAILYVKNNT